MLIKLYADAATQGNPGPSGAGIVIVRDGTQSQQYEYLGDMTNHEAEFAATILAFEHLATLADAGDTVMFYTDSKLVADSIGKSYAKRYPAQIDRLMTLIDRYPIVLTTWIPDRQNQGAHQLALQAIHKRTK
ncbi:ribonuclease HI family protein [Weissella cibaria]|uniref:RnhA_2 protein n=1 Tax=Weissella cibaria TaxID=137591 RepID=A0A0D1LUE7_9LACO|nr:ribonuclease HI family protein [Weissella cibaria]ALI33777.1 ribonuclease HI [Weissella cibaria]KIU19255.1 14.7 kDa ribonuclease H-like protein [Weissella cibaria]KIU22177.1 14.7 kDa ribonuclease H-like protein [Weissella cibaria]MBD1502786.1 ribonuclease HI family protein [Weissella cibaria]MCG4287417.1 ribonuclease HI family protein [Weissella cibaria]